MRRECFCEDIYRMNFWGDIPVDMSTGKRHWKNPAQYFNHLLRIFIFINNFPSTGIVKQKLINFNHTLITEKTVINIFPSTCRRENISG